MDNPWLARFANVPALVAPQMRERFESNLRQLADRFGAELSARQGEQVAAPAAEDEFWTELGPRVTKALRPYVVRNGILQLPVRGVLLNGFPYQFFDFATGYEYIAKAFERGLADPDFKGIALVIDSPGGEVSGNFDLVDRMFAARGQKPTRAFASEYAFSAAYSIASVADSLVVARTGGVGSIGVVTMHVDLSQALADSGVKVTFIHAGAHKVDGNRFEPLPEAVRAAIQDDIDYVYGIFVDTVARNRGLEADAVRATEADTFRADEALKLGLADKVGALDDALAEFAADLTNPNPGDETMTEQKVVTVASVKADHPEVAAALIAEGKGLGTTEANTANAATSKAAIDAAVATAIAGERTRIAKLDGYLEKYGSNDKAKALITAAKADGTAADAVAVQLVDSGAVFGATVIGALANDDQSAAGARPAGEGPNGGQQASTPEGWKAEWEASAKLKAEFPTADAYVAYKKGEASGRVRVA